MSTLAERLAALKRGSITESIPITVEQTEIGQTIPAPVSVTVDSPVDIAEATTQEQNEESINPQHTLAESLSVSTNIDNTDKTIVNAAESSEELIREITKKAFGYAEDYETIVRKADSIHTIIKANGFNNAYSVAEWQMMSAAFNHEMVRVSDMSITQIRYRIEGLLALITASKAMINACIETEKEKKKRETALERETREELENESYERDKKNNRLRKKANVDKHGAIVAAKTPISERDKFIKKMISKGMSNDAAERLWDED